jgi:hypothetical protein
MKHSYAASRAPATAMMGEGMRFQYVVAGVLSASLAIGTPRAEAIELTPAIAHLYSSVEILPPTASRMTVCYGFVCRLRYILDFTPADRRALTDLFNKGKASPEAERRAAQLAVQWLDRRMGPILGMTKRLARADFRHRDDDHNYDCYDTTRNAVSLLLVIREWGLLRHHVLADPEYRGRWLVGQTPHNTAVLKERASGKQWVVDLWTKAYGELPDVMTVEKWLTEN